MRAKRRCHSRLDAWFRYIAGRVPERHVDTGVFTPLPGGPIQATEQHLALSFVRKQYAERPQNAMS